MLNTFALQIAKDRMTDLRRINWQNRLVNTYPDVERQPKHLKHWTNR